VSVKEFVIYTGLRLLLLVSSFAIIAGIWLAITDELPLLWPILLAFLVSGVASYFLLNPQRERFARRVEERAARATAAFEQMKAREDGPDDK
jgi:hypothetical protein